MSGELFWKIVFYGPAGAGKTTMVDTLYALTQEKYTDVIQPTGKITKIAKASGATLYFDRGIFQSVNKSNVYYHVYTVAGQENLAPLRKKILDGTDAIIFVFDAQPSMLDYNLRSMQELQNTLGKKAFDDIFLMILVNKQDLPDTYKSEDIESLIVNNPDFLDSNILPSRHFIDITECCALYHKEYNIYHSFIELLSHLAQDPKIIPSHLIT